MKGAEKKGKNKELILKLCLYFISLWFLLFMLIVLTLDVEHFPNAFSLGQLALLWKHNAVALICMVMFGLSLLGLCYFRNLLDDSKRLPVRIVKCESVNYENLSFLATYIIPLVCFPMQTDRQIFVLFSVIIIMGCIFAKTNLFYSNPTLLLIGFNVYRVTTNAQDDFTEGIIIVQGEIQVEDSVKYFKLSDNVYFGRRQKYEKK